MTEVIIQQLEGGDRLWAKRRKGVQHEETMKSLTDDFVVGNRTLESFLSNISFCVVSFDHYRFLSCTLFIINHMHAGLHHLLFTVESGYQPHTVI